MKTLKILAATAVLASLTLSADEGGKNEDKSSDQEKYIPLDKESTLKEYNPNAVWKDEKCMRCEGKGFTIRVKYNARKNRTEKEIVVCPYCGGKGTFGKSKK